MERVNLEKKGSASSIQGLRGLLAFTALLGGLTALASPQALAGRAYQFTGKVTGIHDDTVALSHGLETLEFSRATRASGDLSQVKIGDEITIWYRLDAIKAEPASAPAPAPAQQPGQAAPDESLPREKKQIIIDDRAFYDARNDAHASDADVSGA